MSAHVFLVAAEPSGDALGADLADALRAADPGIRLSAIGGEQLRARGLDHDVDMSGLAVIGLIEGLKAFDRVRAAVEQAADVIAKADPDAVVLIDSWGFMWRLARALKQRGVRAKRIKLVGPQVWATRPGRARVLARWVDHLLCIHAFEQPFYARWGLPTTVIGNPAIGRLSPGDSEAFRARHGLPASVRIVGILPGSRSGEIRRVAPDLFEAAKQLKSEFGDSVRLVTVASDNVAADVDAVVQRTGAPVLVVGEAEKSDAFAAMDVALACSGTVATELAEQGAAVIVGYRVGAITYAIARAFLLKSRFINLINVAAGREIIPELLQSHLSPASAAAAARRLLNDPRALEQQQRDQTQTLREMAGERPAAEIAAETIMAIVARSQIAK